VKEKLQTPRSWHFRMEHDHHALYCDQSIRGGSNRKMMLRAAGSGSADMGILLITMGRGRRLVSMGFIKSHALLPPYPLPLNHSEFSLSGHRSQNLFLMCRRSDGRRGWPHRRSHAYQDPTIVHGGICAMEGISRGGGKRSCSSHRRRGRDGCRMGSRRALSRSFFFSFSYGPCVLVSLGEKAGEPIVTGLGPYGRRMKNLLIDEQTTNKSIYRWQQCK
jgi:hypothetical protein